MKNLRQFKYLIVFICGVTLVSCKSGKQFAVADMNLPQEFVLPDSATAKLDTLLIPREHLFKDPVLIDLIDKALKNNFDIRISDKEIEINEALFKQSKAAFYPQIDLNLFTIERRWYSRNSRNSASSDWYGHRGKDAPENWFLNRVDHISSAALSWEIDIWGKLRNQKREAGALYEKSYVARKALQTELVATVAEDYYTLLMLDEQLDVAVKNHKFRDSTLAMINLLYNAGEVSALAVQQSQTQVLDAASLISQLKERIEIQENLLKFLTGALPGNIERSDRIQVEDSLYEEVKELPLYLVQNRPDVLIAQYDLMAANARVGVAQAARFPNLTIGATGGLESLLPKNWFNIPGSLFGELVGGLTAPVFKGRKLKTQYQIAGLQRDESEIDFQRKVYGAIVDIENTQASLKGLEEQLRIAVIKQLIADKALTNSRMLFTSGFANYLEVIAAQSDALAAELDLVRTRTSLLIARIQLYRALGGGWE